MSVLVEEVDVWEGQVPDRPGTLSEALAALSASGADLEFTVARRDTKAPGNSIVFVGPLRGEKQSAAAEKIGFRRSTTILVTLTGTEIEDCEYQSKFVGGGAPAGVNDFQQSLGQSITSATTNVTFHVTYSEAVQGVLTGSFAVEAVNGGTVTGTVSNVTGSGATRDVTVTLTGGGGEFRLKPTN